MKRSNLLLVFLILIINNGCKETRVKQDESLISIYTPSPTQDMSCRQTIQKLYSIESYCPDNLIALQQLFTKDFNQQYKPSLDRCNEINKYSITKLLSPGDNDFPATINESNALDTLIYYVEIEIESKSGMPLGNTPSAAWIYMKVNELGQCQIDKITGGG
jgi:hypothetical protein